MVGRCKESESTISFTNAGGADAVNAMNGAILKAFRLPRLLKALRKLEPLLKKKKKLMPWLHLGK